MNTRRIARELALKVLFQVDVGKQPLSEVLDGALDQIRVTVTSPIGQIERDAQGDIRQVATENTDEMSTQSVRQMKQAATYSIGELRKMIERIAGITRAAINEFPEVDTAGAEKRVDDAVDSSRAIFERIAERDSLYPQRLAAIAEHAEKWARQIDGTFRKHIGGAVQTSEFVVRLVLGATDKQNEINERISALSAHWALDRQAAVDRNIMRLAAYEILYETEIPVGASINEAVELAKKYSTEKSGEFVNGVLGKLASQSGAVKTTDALTGADLEEGE